MRIINIGDKQYRIRLTVGTVKAVRDETGIDLLKPQENVGLLDSDYLALAEVLYVLAKAEDPTLDKQKFFDALAGDDLEVAQRAFAAEWTDFFPKGPIRTFLTKIEAMKGQITQKIETELVQKMNEILTPGG